MEANLCRLTPEMILEAYEVTGLKPGRGEFFPEQGCACGLGAYAAWHDESIVTEAKEGYIEEAGEGANDFVMGIFPQGYTVGFANAFDGQPEKKWSCNDSEFEKNYNMGYEDGAKAVAALHLKYSF